MFRYICNILRSDYNINIVKIKYVMYIVGWNKNYVQDA